jgi:isoamylase
LFRDSLRQAQNELGNMTIYITQDANDFSGSSNLFQASGRSPWNSTNSHRHPRWHDAQRRLFLQRFQQQSGMALWSVQMAAPPTNYSWDQGMSAGTGTAYDQRRAARTGLAFVMLSAGTPIMQGGDEYLRTLQCNNNAYNLDSTANWLNYSWNTNQSNFYNFAQRADRLPSCASGLASSHVVHVQPARRGTNPAAPSRPAVTGTTPAIIRLLIPWTARRSAMPIRCISPTTAGPAASPSRCPPPPTGTNWYRVTDTCDWNDGPNTFVTPGNETLIGGSGTTYSQCGQSLLLLISK